MERHVCLVLLRPAQPATQQQSLARRAGTHDASITGSIRVPQGGGGAHAGRRAGNRLPAAAELLESERSEGGSEGGREEGS